MFTNSQMKYLARESFGMYRRMKGMGVVSTLIMSVALLMLALFTLVTVNLHALAESFRSEIEIDVFVKDGLPLEEALALRERLAQLQGFQAAQFVSKEEALAEFRAPLHQGCQTLPFSPGRAGGSLLGKADQKYLAPDLLIIDDFGLSSLSSIQAEDFYEIVAERHLKSSIAMTSNRPPQDWISLFPDPVLANSALDRLAHHAHHLIMEGESYRKKLSPKSSQKPSAPLSSKGVN